MSAVSKFSQFYSGFSPQSIPSLALWLDAADLQTLTLSGSNVTAWADKSRNGFNATSTGASNFPSYSNNSVVYNGAAVRMRTQYTATPAAETVFTVVTWVTAASDRFNPILGSSGLFGRNWVINTGGGGDTGTIRWDVLGQGNYAHTSVTRNQRTLATGVFTGTAGSTSIYGSNQGTPASFTISPGSVTTNIGHIFTESDPMNGVNIHEIVVCSNVLSLSERQTVEGYLAWKWGLVSNVPSGHIVKYVPPVLRAFQPTDISGCVVWLDAADSTTVTLSSGSNASSWADKSGLARTFNGTAVYTSSNGFPCMRFSATSMAATSNYAVADLQSNANHTLIMVINVASNITTNSSMFGFNGTLNSDNRLLIQTFPSPSFPHYKAGANTTPELLNCPIVWDTRSIFLFNRNNFSNLAFRRDGGAATSNNSYPSTSSNWQETTYTGGIGTWGAGFRGDVHEVIYYSNDIGTAGFQRVESYLSDKWGLRSALPTAHPFKLTRSLSPPFNPLMLGDCRLWLDAAESSTFTFTGSNITLWRDKSDLSNHQSRTVGTATVSNDSVYNRVGVFFSNARFNNSNLSINTVSNTNVFSMFTAHRFTSTGGTIYRGPQRIWLRWGSFITDTDPQGYVFTSSDLNTDSGTSSFVHDVSTAAAYMNGALLGTAAKTSNVSNFSYNIGAQPDLGIGEYFRGYMFELAFFNRNLNRDDRQRMEGYLAWKWGLQGRLPASHPFKEYSP